MTFLSPQTDFHLHVSPSATGFEGSRKDLAIAAGHNEDALADVPGRSFATWYWTCQGLTSSPNILKKDAT